MKTRLDDVPVDFAAWRAKHRLNVTAAAALLGISRTVVARYENHGAPVSRTVRLAMVGAEQEISRKHTAIGHDLDALAGPLIRQPGEPDADFRKRIMER
jgi:hypothetical protein